MTHAEIPSPSAPTRIEVSAYTRPGDVDSAPGIRQALKDAKLTGCTGIIFESGRYILRSYISHQTEGIIHDTASVGLEPKKDCHLLLHDLVGLTLRGVSNDQGEPRTVLVGWNDQKNHGFLPSIIWCENCPDLRLENLSFTREPLFTSAGLVTEKTANDITVEVFSDCPAWDRMGAYCANRFSEDGQTLAGESVTYGNQTDCVWREIGYQRLKLTPRMSRPKSMWARISLGTKALKPTFRSTSLTPII